MANQKELQEENRKLRQKLFTAEDRFNKAFGLMEYVLNILKEKEQIISNLEKFIEEIKNV